jgi:hypothetical protein
VIHVLPINDVKPHVEAGFYCHCKPRIDGELVIHNSYDGREFYEEDELCESNGSEVLDSRMIGN